MKVFLRVLGVIAACIGIYFSVNMINTSKEMANSSKETNNVGQYMIDSSERIKVPSKFVYVSSASSAYDKDWSDNTGAQYLGGDAYNYIVEASLKAGYYDATVTRKTMGEVGGTMLQSFSGFFSSFANAFYGFSIFFLFFSVFFLFFSLYSLQNCLSTGAHEKKETERDSRSIHTIQLLEQIAQQQQAPFAPVPPAQSPYVSDFQYTAPQSQQEFQQTEPMQDNQQREPVHSAEEMMEDDNEADYKAQFMRPEPRKKKPSSTVNDEPTGKE